MPSLLNSMRLSSEPTKMLACFLVSQAIVGSCQLDWSPTTPTVTGMSQSCSPPSLSVYQVCSRVRLCPTLVAVSKGNPAWFDGERSYIIPGAAKELAELRALVQRVENKVPLHLKNGVFKMKAWTPDASVFVRPGTKD